MCISGSLNRLIISTILIVLFLLSDAVCHAAKKKDKKATKGPPVMTVIELQSEVMGFADRTESVLYQSFLDFDASKPDAKTRNYVQGDIVYTMSAAFNIAAQPNPEVALLDMIVIVSLGRSIYENDHRPTFGKSVDAIVKGFRTLEKDIWNIAARVLDPAQQHELRRLILRWRRKHPDQTAYAYIRFGDFAKDRTRSTLVPKGKTRGLFKSVKEATQQVEETRMLAERGMYLATRLPLLTGNFAEHWMSNLLANPQMFEILNNLNRVTVVSERLAAVAEQLPQQIARERRNTIKQAAKEMATLRQATIDQVLKEANIWRDTTVDKIMAEVGRERETMINQFMNRLAMERHDALQEFMAEEQLVKGLIAELRQTISEGNNLMLSATTFAEKIGLDKPSTSSEKPFDILEYRDTIAEAAKTTNEFSTLIDKVNILLGSEGLEQLLTQISKTIATAEDEGEHLVNRVFWLAMFLILIWLVGYVLARLILLRLSKK